ncbi:MULTISPECIES: 3-oxoadipyl-CoA thiolase [unclassified Sphingobium]|uniref:3-oxoadipyl-CoA thiolase n=1 Tax=unclassified Sphingobium TaxID=2611147 RepID=UPI002223F7D7|nr:MULTISPECIES: 3-oxoadipyl-CoA thiolase [unclassified Sphingobium]MCW2412719.1 3-oxoadipyl-CoA thiolase [Sphingobium sp. B8D3D]MCW2414983.1 3-oxoadipyl-CoA thiolase [Sphingobium sp. B8D3A]
MREAFICDAIRTPIGRYGGSLSGIRADDLGALPIKALLERNPQLDPAAIEEVFYGCANQAGEDNRNVARMSLLLAGLPVTVPGVTHNRLCASGLEAVSAAARAIGTGEMQLALAGGVESMSRAPLVMGKATGAFDRDQQLMDTTMGWRFVNPALDAAYGTETMPRTAENVASAYQISRADQDEFALRSQQRAAAAKSSGFHDGEILPVAVPGKVRGETDLMSFDEHPRPTTSLETLSRLKPLFGAEGTVTAGNASGINDGAAAMIIATEQAAKTFGLTPRARILGAAAAGVEPGLMGIGPVPATQKLMQRLDLTIRDFDAIELNEAFASQSLAVLRLLGLEDDAAHVNAHGGAIALGHPLGMSGARLALTLVRQLEQTGGKRGLATLCVGVGMGLALAVERV